MARAGAQAAEAVSEVLQGVRAELVAAELSRTRGTTGEAAPLRPPRVGRPVHAARYPGTVLAAEVDALPASQARAVGADSQAPSRMAAETAAAG